MGPTALAAQGFQACAWEQPFYLKFAGIATANRAGQWLSAAAVTRKPQASLDGQPRAAVPTWASLASLFEHGHLALIVSWAATRTAGGADHR